MYCFLVLFPEFDKLFVKFRSLSNFGVHQHWLQDTLKKVVMERKKNFKVETEQRSLYAYKKLYCTFYFKLNDRVDVLQLLFELQQQENESMGDDTGENSKTV